MPDESQEGRKSDAKAVFLDTNVFMHYCPIDQIDWLSWVEADELQIVISRVVIQELDRHKDKHPNLKLRHRARKRLQQIEGWLDGVVHRLRENVIVVADLTHPGINFDAYKLSEHQPDDVLIAAMIQYRENHPNHDLLLVSHDVGPRLKAASLGISRIPMSDDYRLPTEIDPAEKEAQELRQRVQKLEHALPRLQLAFAAPSGYQIYQDITIYEVQPPTDRDIAERVDQLRANHRPMVVEKASEDLLGLGVMSGLAKWHEITPADIREYNARLEEYFLRYETYLRTSARERIKRGLTAKLRPVLVNDGGRPSDDIDVHMHFPDGPTPYTEDALPKQSEPPSAPAGPKSQYEKTLGLGTSMPYLGAHHGLRASFPDLSPRNVSGYEIKKTNSHDVNVHVGRVKHGTHEELPSLFLAFPDFDTADSFSFTYRLHAADIPDVVEGVLHVNVRKSREAES